MGWLGARISRTTRSISAAAALSSAWNSSGVSTGRVVVRTCCCSSESSMGMMKTPPAMVDANATTRSGQTGRRTSGLWGRRRMTRRGAGVVRHGTARGWGREVLDTWRGRRGAGGAGDVAARRGERPSGAGAVPAVPEPSQRVGARHRRLGARSQRVGASMPAGAETACPRRWYARPGVLSPSPGPLVRRPGGAVPRHPAAAAPDRRRPPGRPGAPVQARGVADRMPGAVVPPAGRAGRLPRPAEAPFGSVTAAQRDPAPARSAEPAWGAMSRGADRSENRLEPGRPAPPPRPPDPSRRDERPRPPPVLDGSAPQR